MSQSTKSKRRPLEREDLFRLKLVGDVNISPDGTHVAFVVKSLDQEKDEYVANIHVWADGESKQYTSGGKDSSPRWSPDGSKLAFLSGRDEKNQLFVISASGGEAVQKTKLELGAGEPVWSPDSKRIAFSAATPFPKRDEEQKKADEKRAPTKVIDRAVFKFDGAGFNHDRRSHIFVLTLETGEVDQLTEGDFNDRTPAWSPDGRRILFSANRKPDWDTQRGLDLWVIAASGGEARRLNKAEGVWGGAVFSPDGSRIAYMGFPLDEDEEPDYWAEVWIADRGLKQVTNILEGTDTDIGRSLGSDWSVAGSDSSLSWRPQGVYFLISQRGSCNIYQWDGERLEAATSGDQDVMSYSVAADGTLAYAKSDATHPAEIYMCKDGKESQISHENESVLQGLDLRRPEHITLVGEDGEDIEGWVLKPTGFRSGQTYPLLLYIHGGPQTAYGHTFFHELQWWAGQGYGVAYSNPHGGASYGRSFQNSIRHDWGNRDYLDVMSFTDAVAKLAWVDQSRMAAAGGSYGGYMVNWLAGHTDRFSAFCTQRSICNMVSQGGTSDFAAFRQDRSGGTPEGNPEILWNQSPLKFASQVKTPTLILHQEQDHRCPIEEGEQWFSALKRLGVPTRFIRFPEESHGMSRTGKPSRRFERLGHMRDWFAQYV
ncbi:MAG TPA: S9 family peptidase [Chloroflexota bacterium]|nr:S9 family peptidase [Chloroflexota bacterium]